MKRVGIITFYKSENIGAVLQAYALQKKLHNLGFQAEIIQYTDKIKRSAKMNKVKRVFHKLWFDVIKRGIFRDRKWRRTCDFVNTHILLSKEKYSSSVTLHRTPPVYDVYITGSDQVWNPNITGNDESYFLTFAPAEKRRISYGASLGNIDILNKNPEKIKYLLRQLDAISVREKDAAEAIEQLTGNSVTQVLDPTILLTNEDWSSLTKEMAPLTEKPYILCYYIPGDPAIEQGIRNAANYLKQKTGYEIINLGKKDKERIRFSKEDVFDNGPLEFLWYVEHASYVVTNSFHGTAFSINFKKPFFVPRKSNENKTKSRASRIVSILELTGLSERMFEIDDNGKLVSDNYPDDAMDFTDAHQKLNTLRQESLSFLENNCNEEQK